MITPEQRADIIYNKMTVDMKIDKWQNKQCALNAVDEIIVALSEAVDEEVLGVHTIYWNKVKKAIEKI